MIIFIRILLFFFGSILVTDSVYLLSLKKIHLGILLPLIIGIIFLSTSLAWQTIQHYLKQHSLAKKLWKLAWYAFSIWTLTLMGFFWQLNHKTQYQHSTQDPKAIIVLGSGVSQGQPTPILAERLNTATKLAHEYPNAKIILTGGLDFNEKVSEAEVMSKYLKQKYQILNSRMILETESTSTELNLKNSTFLMQQQQINKKDRIAIVTSDFHTFRAQAIAKKQNFTNIVMVSAPTPKLTRYNAWIREYFAFISGKILKEY